MAKTLTIELPDELSQQLDQQATQLNLSPEALVLCCLSKMLAHPAPEPAVSHWPEAILSFTGIPDFPPFESYRDDLLPPRKVEL